MRCGQFRIRTDVMSLYETSISYFDTLKALDNYNGALFRSRPSEPS
jgi:hypothetical protein